MATSTNHPLRPELLSFTFNLFFNESNVNTTHTRPVSTSFHPRLINFSDRNTRVVSRLFHLANLACRVLF